MTKNKTKFRKRLQIEVIIRSGPNSNAQLVDGLIHFAKLHPQWHLTSRSSQFKYTSELLKHQHIDGMLIFRAEPTVIDQAKKARIPHVELMPRKTVKHPAVDMDDTLVGQRAAQTLKDMGFSHYACCGVNMPWSDLRIEAFKSTLNQSSERITVLNIAFNSALHWVPTSRDARKVKRWLSQMHVPTAVFATNDAVAAMIIHQALDCGLRVPDDIAVLGVGDNAMYCELCPVPISSVKLDFRALAWVGCELLESLLKRRRRNIPLIQIPPGPVVTRRSTEMLAFDDPWVRDVVYYIRTHACDRLRVEELCRVFHVSSRTLNRRLTECLGHSPVREILYSRLRITRQMIESTRTPLAEIALACGFTDQAHLCRQFHDAFGYPPGQLRQ